MRRLLLAVLLLALCAGRAPAETREDLYWRLHRERNAVTRYGAPPTGGTNGVTLLEYVESTGSQYVDTEIVPVASTFAFHGVFAVRDLSTTHGIFGCRNQDATSGTHSYNAFIHNGAMRADTIGDASWSVSVAVDTPIDYNYTPTKTTINGTSKNNKAKVNALYSFYLFNFHVSYGAYSGGGVAQRVYSWTIHVGNTLVRDFRPVKDAAGVAGLLDMVSGEIFYSATSTPLVAGPELRPATVLPTVSRETVREMLAPAPTGEPPELAGGDLWLDCLAIPEGNWLCECPIAGTTNTAWRAALCPSNILRAVVWRHAVGIAPTNLPVTLEHDPSRVIGRIERLYYEVGTGIVARISVTQSGYAWAVSNHCDKPSPDVRCFTSGTNVAIRTDGWTYEHQDYLDERVVPMLQRDGSARSLAELETFTTLTNVPANVEAIVMAPIYFRGLSFVEKPLLPTYLELEVPENLRHAYPIRPPRQWTWRNGD